MIPVTYEPNKNHIDYISSLGADAKLYNIYTDDEKDILESRNEDLSYPGQWCDAVMLGGYNMEISSEIHTEGLQWSPNQYNMLGELNYEVNTMNLNKPLISAYGTATKITVQGFEFGQDNDSTVPSRLDVEVDVEHSQTSFKWYYNGTLVNTDTISDIITEFAIAVENTNFILTKYAFIYMKNGVPWTSGGLSNSDVLTKIINNAGSKTIEQNPTGWITDPDDPDNPENQFILSKLYSLPGYPNTLSLGTNNVAASDEILYNNIYNKGGYLGTDLVVFITPAEYSTSAAAWSYLTTDPESDGCTMNIPSADGETEYKIIWNYDDQRFEVWEDETLKAYSYSLSKIAGSYIYIGTNDNGTQLGWALMGYYSGSYDYHFRLWNINESLTEVQEFDYNQIQFEETTGYDPEGGQEDDPQPDADEIEDPSVDALDTGFVYAFAVNQTDMENLVSCLNPDTLADKIKADFGNHLYDFIVSYHTMPCVTNADNNAKIGISYRGVPFTYGGGTPLELARITKSFYQVDLNSKVCQPSGIRPTGFENWSNASVQVYLPFIGYQHLNTADVWGKPVRIVYYFDVLAGTCTANISVPDKGTLYSFEGSCSYKIPFSSVIDQNVQNMMSGIMSAGSALIGTATNAAAGNIAGAVGSAMGGAGAVGSFISAFEHKATISRGGQLGGSAGWHVPRTPALIITVPDIIEAGNNYISTNGYPCYQTGTLGSRKGSYVEITQIDLKPAANNNGAYPNDDELDLIRAALKDGVYV